MKKNVIIVPRDICPLDILAKMGYRTKNAWIFLHQNAYEELKDSCNHSSHILNLNYFNLIWNATDEHPRTELCVFVKAWSIGSQFTVFQQLT